MPNCHKGKTLRFVVSTCVGLREFLNANEIHISWGEKSQETQAKEASPWKNLEFFGAGGTWQHCQSFPVRPRARTVFFFFGALEYLNQVAKIVL